MRTMYRVRNEVVGEVWGCLKGGERERHGELREGSNSSGSFSGKGVELRVVT